MSEMMMCDFFIIIPFFCNKKAPPISGRANKKGDKIAYLTWVVLYQKLVVKSTKI